MAYVYRKRWTAPEEFETQAKARYGDSIFDDGEPHPANDTNDAPEPQAATVSPMPDGTDPAWVRRFEGAIEDNVLAAICWSQNLAGELIERIKDPGKFSTEPYRVVARAAFDYFAEWRRPPRGHLADVLEQQIKHGDAGRFLRLVVDEVIRLGPQLDEQYVRASLSDFLDARRAILAVNKASDIITDGGYTRAALAEVKALLTTEIVDVRPDIVPTMLNAGKVDAPPAPRQWLLGTTFCRRFLSAAIGPGNVGKTALRLVQAMAVATGKPLTGEYVHKRGRVLYITLEDNLDELSLRMWAARLHHNIDPEELDGWLHLYAPPVGDKLAIGKKSGITPGRLASDLRAQIIEHRIDLVILDPFVKSYGGDIDENSNSAIDAVCAILVRLSIELNFAPDVLHHDAKGAREPGDIDRGRGASAFRDAGRLMYTVTTMSETEAERFHIAEDERKFYFRYDPAKVNIAPPGEAKWFHLVGVAIGNGDLEYPNGDTVQTVEPWTPPQIIIPTDDILADLAAGLANGQRYSDAPSAKDRAAWQVVKQHCPELGEKECRRLIKKWSTEGTLYNRQYDDPVERKPRQGLYVREDARNFMGSARHARKSFYGC